MAICKPSKVLEIVVHLREKNIISANGLNKPLTLLTISYLVSIEPDCQKVEKLLAPNQRAQMIFGADYVRLNSAKLIIGKIFLIYLKNIIMINIHLIY